MNIPPPDLLMQTSNNPSGEDFIASFEHMRDDSIRSLRAAGVDFSQITRILDFGCGVGRFLFAIRPQLQPHQKLFGCDVNRDCATWCRENIDFAEIEHTALNPPLPYADGSFDFIYALSVFTHLSFDLQFAWAMELHRVIRPGGVIFFTTHGELHLPLALASPYAEKDYALIGDDGLLWTFAEARKREIEGQREVAVIHSRSAIEHVFSSFNPLYHRRISNLAAGQSLSIRQRPPATANIVAVTPARKNGVLKTSQNAADPVVFSLPGFTGVRPFRLLLSFDERWHSADTIVYGVEVVGEGARQIKRGIVDLPFKSFGGPRHFLPMTVDIPGDGTPCDVIWTLSWKDTWRPRSEAIRFALSHARLESYPDVPPSARIDQTGTLLE